MAKELKSKKIGYKTLDDIPMMSKHVGLFDKDPFAMVPNKDNFKLIAALRKRARKEGMLKDPEIFYGMIVSFIACATTQLSVDIDGEEVNNGIPLNLNALAAFCGLTYNGLWRLGQSSEAHKELYQWVKDIIEMDLEDLLTRKETFHQGIANRLKCRYPETWDRNTILAETIGEDTKFNFTIE